jgi:tetratricopeptide (TPR) repeat protein
MTKILILLACFPFAVTFSQISERKSNSQCWSEFNNTSFNDSTRLNALYDLSVNHLEAFSDSTLILSEMQAKLAHEWNSPSFEAYAYNTSAGFLKNRGKCEEALTYYKKSLVIREKLGNKKAIASSLNSMADAYRKLSDFPKALECALRGLKLREELNDAKTICKICITIGVIYKDMEEYDLALSYQHRAFKLLKEQPDNFILTVINSNIGGIFHGKGDYLGCIPFYKEALKTIDTNYLQTTGDIYSSLGGAYADLTDSMCKIAGINSNKKFEMASDYLVRSLRIKERTGDSIGIGTILLNLGSLYINKKKFTNAEKYLMESFKISGQINYPETMRDAQMNLAALYEQKGDYKSALKAYETYYNLRDKIFNDENRKKTMRKELNFAFEKKQVADSLLRVEEKKIASVQLEQHRSYIYILIGFSILIIMIAALGIRQVRFSNQQKEMALEQKLLRSQMNPHFIFNSLQAIQNFILKNDQKDAVKYLGSFASITRTVLESSRFEKISVKKEIALLENYLQLQKLRFGERFDYMIHVDPSIDIDNMDLPPMLSQPFIENALEHGMRDIENGGKIDIYFTVKDNNLLFEVVDNGKGIKTEDAETKQHQSMALAITKERIALMNKRARHKATFTISEAFPLEAIRKGVKVNFSIPL